jgi:putative ABC transport system permease protein
VGIVNAMLIQVRARSREFALYRVVGMSAGQVTRLLLIEGAITGLVGGVLALVLGVPLGMISVSFLDRFTLFDLEYAASLSTMVLVFLGAVAVCSVAAIYPAVKATQISSAESLHYE